MRIKPQFSPATGGPSRPVLAAGTRQTRAARLDRGEAVKAENPISDGHGGVRET
jgi:hypothetical protein